MGKESDFQVLILDSNHIKERPIQMDDLFVILSLLPGIDE